MIFPFKISVIEFAIWHCGNRETSMLMTSQTPNGWFAVVKKIFNFLQDNPCVDRVNFDSHGGRIYEKY